MKPPRKKNERGVALMLVLSAIAVLTVAGVEFAYNTNVAYHLAQNERDRLQAYYLAKSAFQFMALELKYDRVYRQVVSQQNLGQFLGANAALPLCQQFPLSTALIRAVFLGEEGDGKKAELPPEMKKMVSMAQVEGASSFLDFEGDFDGACIDEATKINLNIFATLDPERSAATGALNPYNQSKQFLSRFLENPKYKTLFELSGVEVDDVVRNIADWVDTNEQINDVGGRNGGPEASLYEREGRAYRMKNEKMTTLLETFQIAGVADNWFGVLKDNFTIYGDGKINICMADEPLVIALIRRYMESTPGLPPLRLDDPEVMGRLVAAVGTGCSSGAVGDAVVQSVASSLMTAITTEEGGQGVPPPVPAPGAPPPAGGGTTTGAGAATTGGLAEMITGKSRYYTLNLTGQVHDTIVRLSVVVDTKENDPKRWPILYWKIY